MKKYTLLLLSLTVIFTLSACSGGGSSPANESLPSDSDQTPEVEPAIPGGSPSLPTTINLAKTHEISSDSFTNYFEYTAVANEKLVIHTTLTPTTLISGLFSRRCAGQADSFIKIYTENFVRINTGSTCEYDLTHEFLDSGTYIIQFDYPPEFSGFADIASIGGTTQPSSISTGRPDAPFTLSLTERNTILNNTFYNYFEYTAVANEKLVIHTTLTPTTLISGLFSRRCAGQADSFIKIYTENFVRINTGSTCEYDLTHEFLDSGTYIIQFDYPPEFSGFAEAGSI